MKPTFKFALIAPVAALALAGCSTGSDEAPDESSQAVGATASAAAATSEAATPDGVPADVQDAIRAAYSDFSTKVFSKSLEEADTASMNAFSILYPHLDLDKATANYDYVEDYVRAEIPQEKQDEILTQLEPVYTGFLGEDIYHIPDSMDTAAKIDFMLRALNWNYELLNNAQGDTQGDISGGIVTYVDGHEDHAVITGPNSMRFSSSGERLGWVKPGETPDMAFYKVGDKWLVDAEAWTSMQRQALEDAGANDFVTAETTAP